MEYCPEIKRNEYKVVKMIEAESGMVAVRRQGSGMKLLFHGYQVSRLQNKKSSRHG
jgi:hypothetical protein